MGTASSLLTQYDIEEVQEHCNNLCRSVSQQEIVSLYQRFCQLDRIAKGFISADEFLSIPEFAMTPLSQRLLKMVDGLNFMDFVAFLSAFSAKANLQQKIELIFKVYDSDCNGKVSYNDILEVFHDLSGSFMSDEQREQVLTELLKEAGYNRESFLTLEDFIKVYLSYSVVGDYSVKEGRDKFRVKTVDANTRQFLKQSRLPMPKEKERCLRQTCFCSNLSSTSSKPLYQYVSPLCRRWRTIENLVFIAFGSEIPGFCIKEFFVGRKWTVIGRKPTTHYLKWMQEPLKGENCVYTIQGCSLW